MFPKFIQVGLYGGERIHIWIYIYKSQHLQNLVWLRYINDIFFIWTHGEESYKKFLDEPNGFNQYINMSTV